MPRLPSSCVILLLCNDPTTFVTLNFLHLGDLTWGGVEGGSRHNGGANA